MYVVAGPRNLDCGGCGPACAKKAGDHFTPPSSSLANPTNLGPGSESPGLHSSVDLNCRSGLRGPTLATLCNVLETSSRGALCTSHLRRSCSCSEEK